MAADKPTSIPEEPAWRSWARTFGISAVAGLFMALSGAFNTAEAPLATRLLFWEGLMLAGALGGRLSAVWVVMRIPFFDGRVWASIATVTVLISVPYLFVAWAFSAWTFHEPLRSQNLIGFAIPVVLISAIMTTVSVMAEWRPRETHAHSEAAGPPRFHERLPLKLRGAEIYAVEAEDHYLRVHTDRGSDLILMRLGDAVGELDGLEGAQTHRSWWVAKAAVTGAERGDGRAVFTLKGGLKAPVSRTYARVLRREGWY